MHLDLPIKLKLVWFLIMTSKDKMRQQIFEIVHKRFSTLCVNVQTMKKKTIGLFLGVENSDHTFLSFLQNYYPFLIKKALILVHGHIKCNITDI